MDKSSVLFTNARVFDGTNGECPTGMSVLVEGSTVREISARPIKAQDAVRIDVGNRTLMPGLIDAHIHAYASDVNFQKVDAAGEPYRTAHATRMLAFALECGFTTVRDVGGADYSLWRAIEDGLIKAPRLFYAGRALSMTGGHGDFRAQNESRHTQGYCSCGDFNFLGVVADGVDACIRAAREELRRGAHCIKIMGSGGVSSPSDPVWMNQYREDEIRAIVGETTERRTYTTAHCHPPQAIRRCIECGVRVIEHGTLIDEPTAAFAAERGTYIVPTMAVIFAMKEQGRRLGFPAASQEKIELAFQKAVSGMEIMRRAGVRIGFGTDLLGETYTQQCREFSLRKPVFSPLEILRQATSTNAAILMQEDELGCIKPGARADILVVDGDPLADIELLAADGRHLPVIMRDGHLVRNRLS